MLEFETLVYLDLQKTATTSITSMLRRIVDEKESVQGAHTWPEQGHDTSRYHFLSLRDPLSIYISLFGHGCSGLGGLYRGFKRRGHDHLYEPSLTGFERWLAFVLEPENANEVAREYGKVGLAPSCGFVTHRLLMLSIVDAAKSMRSMRFDDRQALGHYFDAHRIFDRYVRVEKLLDDLLAALHECRDRVSFRQLPETRDQLAEILPRKNVGEKIEGLSRDTVSDELRERVRDRDWLIYDRFGYADDPRGAPPPLPPRAPDR